MARQHPDAIGRVQRRHKGQYTDPETGLIYLRNRYYDPTTAQFLSRDPLVAQTRSAYGYVDNNPLNETDPLGLFSWSHAFKVAAAVIGGAAVVGLVVAAAVPTLAIGSVAVGTAALIAGGVSTAFTAAATIADCRKRMDANCGLEAATTAVGVLSLGAGGGALALAAESDARYTLDIYSGLSGVWAWGVGTVADFFNLNNDVTKYTCVRRTH